MTKYTKILTGIALFISSTVVISILTAALLTRENSKTSQNSLGGITPDSRSEEIASTGLTLTSTEVAKHTTLADCWLIISGKVYDVSRYIVQHPGGAIAIQSECGKDATNAFRTQGGKGSHSNTANNLLNSFLIGTLGSSVTTNTSGSTPGITQPNDSTSIPVQPSSGSSSGSLPSAITTKYPISTKISGGYEDNGSWEGKISVNGQCHAIKVNSGGSLTEDKNC